MVKSLRRCSAVKSARLHTPTELSVGPRQQSPPSPSNHSPVVIKNRMAPAPRTRSIQLLGTAVPTHAVPLVHVDNPPIPRAVRSPPPTRRRSPHPARYTIATPPLPQVLVARRRPPRVSTVLIPGSVPQFAFPPPRNASTSHWVPTAYIRACASVHSTRALVFPCPAQKSCRCRFPTALNPTLTALDTEVHPNGHPS